MARIELKENTKHVLSVLAEAAIQSFDDDRGITERDLLKNFTHIIETDPDLHADLELISDDSCSDLLNVVEDYVTKPHWEGNNFDTLSDAFRAFSVNHL